MTTAAASSNQIVRERFPWRDNLPETFPLLLSLLSRFFPLCSPWASARRSPELMLLCSQVTPIRAFFRVQLQQQGSAREDQLGQEEEEQEQEGEGARQAGLVRGEERDYMIKERAAYDR